MPRDTDPASPAPSLASAAHIMKDIFFVCHFSIDAVSPILLLIVSAADDDLAETANSATSGTSFLRNTCGNLTAGGRTPNSYRHLYEPWAKPMP